MAECKRGGLVVVRTAGGLAAFRYLWLINEKGAVVAERDAFESLKRGATPIQAGAVGVPAEDVYEYDPARAAGVRDREPFEGWASLDHPWYRRLS